MLESTSLSQLSEDPILEIEDWGLIEYSEALERQLNLVAKIHSENTPGVLVFCSHPPVVTLGRATQEGDVFAWKGPVIEVSRGGRATYHGPSQLVIYPILNLNLKRKNRGPHEIGGYLRDLEESIVRTLQEYGVQATGKTLQSRTLSGPEAEETGVWIDRRKIASLGVGIKHWITYHGAAINLHHDTNAFSGMNPCGFQASIMTDLETEAKQSINNHDFQLQLLKHLKDLV